MYDLYGERIEKLVRDMRSVPAILDLLRESYGGTDREEKIDKVLYDGDKQYNMLYFADENFQ